MLAEALSIGVKISMKNHIYSFNNEIRVQVDGGSIGVELTGELSEMEMLKWGNTLKTKMRDIGIDNDFQKRLVDDITLIPSVIPRGWKIENEELLFSKKQKLIDDHRNEYDDVRTMKIIQNIANNIDEQFKITFDVPSNHEDGRVPILDVKVSMNKENKVDYIFYKKPMASDKVVLKSYAMSNKQKITTLTQEVFRRLHNTSGEMDENVKIVMLINTCKHSTFFLRKISKSVHNGLIHPENQ